jgi:hypothetical protein
MKRELTDSLGDQSNNFSLISLLPSSIKDQVLPFIDTAYSYAIAFGIIPNKSTAKSGTMLDKTTTYEKQKYIVVIRLYLEQYTIWIVKWKL